MTARLADIAAQSGVSEATVSRVLNGKPGVAAATRQRVLIALDVLGYERPSRLRTRSAGLIGLIVPELENPIFPAFAQAIESALAQHGFTPVLCTQTPGGVTEDDYIELLMERGVSGIVFISGLHADTAADHARYHALVERGLPVVFVNGRIDGLEAPFISDDDAVAMDLAVAHLAALGHTRIGLAVGPERFVPVIRKTRGFTAALRERLELTAAEAHSLGGPLAVLRRGRPGRRRPAARPGRDRPRLRLGPDGARRYPRRPVPRPSGPRRRVGRRLRRQPADRVHRPAAHDGPPIGARDGHRGRGRPARRDRRRAGAP